MKLHDHTFPSRSVGPVEQYYGLGLIVGAMALGVLVALLFLGPWLAAAWRLAAQFARIICQAVGQV